MSRLGSSTTDADTRVLVAIAHHGTKNRAHLQVLLDEYRRMPFDVDIVVLSEAPKHFGDDVEVLVGLPSPSPRSLPFRHRSLFAECENDYDLFIYSEDDTLISARHVRAFLDVTARLPQDRIAGFVRYEVGPNGERSYSSIHSKYAWLPDSLTELDGELYARLSNPHSACFMLTRHQLRRAISSGGFLVEPHTNRESMMVAAATDPYIQCGFTRVIPLSRIEDFLVHHLPNIYVGRLGITQEEFDTQLDVLKRPSVDRRRLFTTEARLDTVAWDKSFYEPAYPGLRRALAPSKRILSVGCGSGEAECAMAPRDAEIVGIPLDSVIGAVAARRGVQVLPPDLDDALACLESESFDRVLLLNVLQHVSDPVRLLRALTRVVNAEGEIIIVVPNIWREIVRARIRGKARPRPAPNDYANAGVHATHNAIVRRWIRDSGLVAKRVQGGGEVATVRRSFVGLLPPYVILRAALPSRNRHASQRGQTVAL